MAITPCTISSESAEQTETARIKPIRCCATCIHYWNCKYKNCRSNNWEHWESEI